MSAKIEIEDQTDESNGETYFQYYMKKHEMWISILISIYLLLDIIALFIATNYTYLQIFFYFGIFLILFTIGANIFIWFTQNYFWALLGSIFFGLLPLIELIIHLAITTLTKVDLIMIIISIFLVIAAMIVPFVLVYARNKREAKEEDY